MRTFGTGIKPRIALTAASAMLMLIAGLTLPVSPRAAYAAPGLVHDLPLPPRTRSRGPNLFTSGRGFRATVAFYRRHLKRRGVRHQAIPVYRYRGVTVARFLSQTASTDWNALHIFQDDGRTFVFILPRDRSATAPAAQPAPDPKPQTPAP